MLASYFFVKKTCSLVLERRDDMYARIFINYLVNVRYIYSYVYSGMRRKRLAINTRTSS